MFPHPREEKTGVHNIEILWGFYVQTHPVMNVCGFSEWPGILSRFSPFSYTFSWVYGIFLSSVGRPAVLPALPPLSELRKQVFGRTAVYKMCRVPRETEWVSVCTPSTAR